MSSTSAATTSPTASCARWGTERRASIAASRPGQVAFACHRQHGPPDPGDEGEQRARTRRCGADADERLCPRSPRCLHGGRERHRRLRQRRWAKRAQHRDADRRVDDHGDTERNHDRPRDRALRLPHLLPERGDARVAREGEEQQAARLKDAVPPGRTVCIDEQTGVAVAAHEHEDDDESERRERAGDKDAADSRGARDAAQVRRGQDQDGTNRDRPLAPPRGRRGVGAERQRHRRARRGLADDESPPGEKAPPITEPLPAVDVRSPRRRILRRELRRRGRIAVRDDGCDREPDEEPATRRRGRRGERGEDSRADHRRKPDDDRVARPEAAREHRRRAHRRAAIRSAASRNSLVGDVRQYVLPQGEHEVLRLEHPERPRHEPDVEVRSAVAPTREMDASDVSVREDRPLDPRHERAERLRGLG